MPPPAACRDGGPWCERIESQTVFRACVEGGAAAPLPPAADANRNYCVASKWRFTAARTAAVAAGVLVWPAAMSWWIAFAVRRAL